MFGNVELRPTVGQDGYIFGAFCVLISINDRRDYIEPFFMGCLAKVVYQSKSLYGCVDV